MKIIAATNNNGKALEICSILSDLGLDIITQKDAGINIEVDETGNSFEENAFLKAKSISAVSGLPAIADDSGLCVDALGGRPGIYSARYAGEGASDDMLVTKLLDEMKSIKGKDRSACFVSAVCLVLPDGRSFSALGKTCGLIAEKPVGRGGFGYDPIFFCPEFNETYAQMSADKKNKLSHRYKALISLKDILKSQL